RRYLLSENPVHSKSFQHNRCGAPAEKTGLPLHEASRVRSKSVLPAPVHPPGKILPLSEYANARSRIIGRCRLFEWLLQFSALPPACFQFHCLRPFEAVLSLFRNTG